MKKVLIWLFYLLFAIVAIWVFYYLIVNSSFVASIKNLIHQITMLWE